MIEITENTSQAIENTENQSLNANNDSNLIKTAELNFEKIATESKNTVNINKTAAKRGRGRPRKIPLNAETGQNTIKAEIVPPPDISGFICKPLKFISTIPAQKYNIPELALNDDEAMECAKSLNELLNAFVPDMESMSPKTAAIFGSIMVFGSIGFQKYSIILENQKQVASENQKNDEIISKNQNNNDSQLNNKIDATDYFRKQ